MIFDMSKCMSVACCALMLNGAASFPVQAEPDALDRPAMQRSAERTTTSVLLAVKRAGNRLVAVGERGLILLSDDNGQTWQQAKVPVSVTLTGVSFVDQKNGWATGHSGVVLGTNDGGKTWNILLDGKRAAELVALEARRSGVKQFVADADRLITDGPDKPFLDVHFFSANRGLIVGAYGLIFSTSDGGRTWQPLQGQIENPKGSHLYAIHDAGEDIYLSGEQGSLFVSNDRGKSFQAIKTPYQGTLFGVFTAGQTLVVFGMRGNALWSIDKGLSWQKSELPGTNTLTASLQRKNGEVLLVDDGGNIFVSTDEGKRFSRSDFAKLTPLNSIIETENGALLLAGARGISYAKQTKSVKDENK